MAGWCGNDSSSKHYDVRGEMVFVYFLRDVERINQGWKVLCIYCGTVQIKSSPSLRVTAGKRTEKAVIEGS